MDKSEYKQKLKVHDPPLTKEVLQAFSSFVLSCRSHPSVNIGGKDSEKMNIQEVS